MINSQLLSSQIHPVVREWALRVQQNGGGKPSSRTVNAANKFYKGLKSTSFFSKIKVVNIFAPDSLIASFCPLIQGAGPASWTNGGGNFSSSDLNLDGLKGDASTKYLNTSINPSTAFISNNIGYSAYVVDNGSGAGHVFGVADSATYAGNGLLGTHWITSSSGMIHFDSYTTTTGRVNKTSLASYVGFTSGNRISSTDSRLFTRASGTSIIQQNSIATGAGSAPNIANLTVFSSWALSAPNFYTNCRMSFFALHDGLSLGEAGILCNLIDVMRRGIGGGFVA